MQVQLANADVNKSAGGDTLIVFDTSASALKRVSASGLGGGKFLGEGSGGAGDIIRVHENELNTSVAIDANNNGLAAWAVNNCKWSNTYNQR